MINQQLDKNIQLFYTKESIEAAISSTKFFRYYTTNRIFWIDESKYNEDYLNNPSTWFWKMIDDKRYEDAAKEFLDMAYMYDWLHENPNAKYSQKETDEILMKYLIEIYEDVELATNSAGQAGGMGDDVKVFKN